MPVGLVWLLVGALIGAAAGWLLVDNFVVGGGAGFLIALALLLVGNRLGGDEQEDEGANPSDRPEHWSG